MYPTAGWGVDHVDDAGAIEVQLLVPALDEYAAIGDEVPRARRKARRPDDYRIEKPHGRAD